MRFDIQANGLQSIIDNLHEFTANADEVVQQALLNAINENIVVVAKTLAPKKTGALKASIAALPGTEPFSALFVATEPYARYLEEGTKPHFIKTKSAKALAFEVQGQTVFAKSVFNPGIPFGKFSFMQPAIAIGLQKATQELQESIFEALQAA